MPSTILSLTTRSTFLAVSLTASVAVRWAAKLVVNDRGAWKAMTRGARATRRMTFCVRKDMMKVVYLFVCGGEEIIEVIVKEESQLID
jgi:hypothetical protein